MGKRTKTRIILEAAGAFRELFAVRELANRDLQIILKVPDEGGDLNGPFDKIIQHKFSIHQNPKSPTGSRTMKRTLIYLDGRKRTSVALWQPRDGAVAALLFAYRPPGLDTKAHLANLRPGDRPVYLGSYSPRSANIAYVVFVGDKGALRFTPSPTLPFTKTLIQFELFEIAVCHTFMNAPSLPRGQLMAVATSSETWEGAEPESRIEGGSPSIELSKLGEFLFNTEIAFRDGYMHQAVNWLLQEGADFDDQKCAELEELANTFSNVPLVQVE